MLPPGTNAERYEILRLIGRGGMASVYEARHTTLGTRHALKVLEAPALRHERRMQREAGVQARLDPDRVVPVTDVVRVGGAPAIVMSLVEGCTLAELIEERPPNVAETAWILSEILTALEVVHAAKVVHRDLKPTNVLLDLAAGRVRLRLADFGLARGEVDVTLTASGTVFGTPAYASPEQLSDSKSVGPSGDVWSVGVIAYELLTGARPFPAETLFPLLDQVRSGVWDPSALQPTWRAWISALLNLDPNRRPGAAEARDLMPEPSGSAPQSDSALARALRVAAARVPAEPDGTSTFVSRHEPERSSFGHGLPVERDAFVGRTDLIEQGVRLWREGARLLTLTGAGGIGKTRLAARISRAAPIDFPGGAWMVDLTEATSLDGITNAVARAFGVELRGDAVAQLGRVIEGAGRCLVVLDNFEQVVAHAGESVGAWLQSAPEATFLVTSRALLGLKGEHALSVPPLSLDEATSLFAVRARARGAVVDTHDQREVAHLVEQLDRLPLAIELAAARATVLTPARMLARLNDRFKLLSSGAGGRQATLRATLDWSWNLLDDSRRLALARLSAFEAGFDLEAAEAVLGWDAGGDWAIDLVQDLVDQSLVQPDGQGRFRLLVSVREYAAERLADLGEDVQHEAFVRHGRHYARFGEPAARWALNGPDGPALLARQRVELDNLFAACRRAIARRDADVAARTYLAVSDVAAVAGPHQAGVELGEALLEAITLPLELEARVRYQAALMLRRVGLIEPASIEYERVAELGACNEDGFLRMLGLRGRAVVKLFTGAPGDAIAQLQEAIPLAEAFGEPGDLASVLMHMGHCKMVLGDTEGAKEAYARSIEDYRAHGNRQGEPAVTGNLAAIHHMVGELDRARPLYEAALAGHRAVGDRHGLSVVLGNLGVLQMDVGDLDAAERSFREASSLNRSLGNQRDRSYNLDNWSRLKMMRGEYDAARRMLDEALQLCRRIRLRGQEGVVTGHIGLLHHRTGDRERAWEELAAGEAILREVSNLEELGKVLAARAGLDGRDRADAERDLAEAEELARTIGCGPRSELARTIAESRAALGTAVPGNH